MKFTSTLLGGLRLPSSPSRARSGRHHAKGRSLLAAASLLTGLACAPQAEAVVTFVFNYKDADGTGFNDPAHPEYKAGLEDAGKTTGSFFAHTATITMDVVSTKTNGNDLAAAGSTYPGLNDATAGFSPSVVQQKVITNGAVDLNGAEADGFVTVNLGQNYQYSPTAVIGANQYDFKGTMVHELAHALGFASNLSATPTAGPMIYTTFDSFLVTSSGAPLINPTTFAFDPVQTYTLTGGNNKPAKETPSVSGEYFSGPNERNRFDGKPLPIYSPNPYEPGSSGSHVDDNTLATKYLLMAAATETAGESMGRSMVRSFGAAEEGVLKDLGFTLASEHATFFTGEIGLQNKAYYLSFPNGNIFGYYSYLSDPKYIYHFDLGYEYTFEANDGKQGVYLYDFKSGGFFYTSPTFPFPYLYDFALNSVVYYFPDPSNAGRYNTNGTRYFYVFSSGTIISK